MARYALTLAALAGASVAAAQTTTVSLIGPQLTAAPLAGSVIAAGKDATTYAVECADGAGADKKATCEEIGTQTITQGPSTWEMNYSIDVAQATGINDAKCSVNFDANVGQCVVTISESVNGNLISSVMTTQLTDVGAVMNPVTITAGADKLTGGGSGSGSGTTMTSSTGNWSSSAAPPTSSVNKGTPPSPTGPTHTTGPSTSATGGGGAGGAPSQSSHSTPVAPPTNTMPQSSTGTTTSATNSPTVTDSAAGRATGNMVFAGVAAALGAMLAM